MDRTNGMTEGEKELVNVIDNIIAWIYDHDQLAQDFETHFPEYAKDYKEGN